ncbi:MAG: hypothetical protein ACT4ON_10255 [Bacteroidota bacterium]
MKNTFILIVLAGLFSCGTESHTYTSNTYFDCDKNNEFKPTADKEALVFAIIERAAVVAKDVPDYGY